MNRRTDQKSQSDIQEQVDQSSESMDAMIGDLDRIQEDVETIRETLANLDFGGTSDGADAVEQSIQDAEDTTVDVFEEEDQKLEEAQEENEALEEEISESSDSSQGDLDKISDASSRIETQESISALVDAKEAAMKDIDFLAQQIERAKQSRDASEQRQQEFQNTMRRKA